MKPQDAKKSNHYYCDQCQRIRQMLGVSSAVQEPVKPPKIKSRNKKSEEGRSGRQKAAAVDLIHDEPATAADSPCSETQRPLHSAETMAVISMQQASPKKSKSQSSKIPRRKEPTEPVLPPQQYISHPIASVIPAFTVATTAPRIQACKFIWIMV